MLALDIFCYGLFQGNNHILLSFHVFHPFFNWFQHFIYCPTGITLFEWRGCVLLQCDNEFPALSTPIKMVNFPNCFFSGFASSRKVVDLLSYVKVNDEFKSFRFGVVKACVFSP